MKTPTFHHERELLAQGYRVIVGVDEAGCAALAGPVVAAAVVLPLNSRLKLIRDSKQLNVQQRERLYDLIDECAYDWAIGTASHREIGAWGLRQANYIAMERAVKQIHDADFVLVDAWTLQNLKLPQRGIIRGDCTVKSIAAASIMAKVWRDRLMINYARTYPQYGFDQHKGYPTRHHKATIKKNGPCAIHRTSWQIFQTF
ncbi:ribonuclease HII [Patescibacteria group bacterium]|nr:ribonuclease HII [Patescibacteria group bacterium]